MYNIYGIETSAPEEGMMDIRIREKLFRKEDEHEFLRNDIIP